MCLDNLTQLPVSSKASPRNHSGSSPSPQSWLLFQTALSNLRACSLRFRVLAGLASSRPPLLSVAPQATRGMTSLDTLSPWQGQERRQPLVAISASAGRNHR
jgi:hypothetical protein